MIGSRPSEGNTPRGASGGTFGYGTLFSLTPPTLPDGSWTYALLYSFTGGSDSGNPNGLTLGPDGILYGTTQGVVGSVNWRSPDRHCNPDWLLCAGSPYFAPL